MTGRVLIVDDSREARFARRRPLEREGFDVIEASTGAEAVATADADLELDLVILDVNLPDISGFEVCRRLRAHPRARHLAVLQISASTVDAQSQATSLEVGADAFLLEPVDPAVLVATARALLRLRQAEEAARRANQRLGLAQRAARTGVWELDPRTGVIWWSREAAAVFGLPDDMQPDLGGWLGLIDERDRPSVDEKLRLTLAEGDRWDEEYRIWTPGGTMRWILAVGRFERDADGVAVHASGIVTDVTERRQAQDRLQALQAATAAMSGALTPDDVIAAGMAAARELLEAAHAAFGMIGEDGARLRIGSDGVPEELASSWRELPVDRSLPGPSVVLDGAPLRFGTREQRLAAFPASDMDRDSSRPNESGAWVPLRGEGGALGFLAVYDERPNAFDDEALALLEAVGRLASQALERAQLFARESAARETAELLNQVTAALEEEQDFHARLRRLLEALVPRLADFATVEALRPDGRLELLALRHRDSELDEPLRRLREQHHFDVDSDIGIAHVIRTGTSELLSDTTPEYAPADPAGARLLDRLAPRSYIAVPLETHEGTVGALMLCTSTSGRRLAERELALADELAARISLVLENARLFDEQRRIARTLQLGLLGGAQTRLDDVTLAMRYQPGEGAAEIGGDWYDAFDREDGTVLVAVGDVVGRGIRAATAMAKLRNAFRAFGLVRDSPAAILEELDRFAQTVEGGAMTTVACLSLDPETGEARYAAAGHPPPIISYPDGHAEALMDGRSPPLMGDAMSRPEATLMVPTGATVALYTDGVVERRGESLDEGIGRMEAAAAALAADPVGTLADRLLKTMLVDQIDDDAALLLIRREDPARPVLFRRVPAEPAVLGSLRASLRGWFARVQLDPADQRDLLLACSEACNNAVEHAYAQMGSGEMCLEARLIGDVAHISVRDFGHWRAPAVAGDRGRGSELMRSLCDAVEVIATTTGTMVTLRRRVTTGVKA